MAEPQRIQLSRRKGFKLPPNTVVVSRPSRWGNPFRVTDVFDGGERLWIVMHRDLPTARSTRWANTGDAVREAVAAHRANLLRGTLGYTLDDVRRELRGKNLACWCPLPEPGHIDLCHAATLLYYANEVTDA